MPNTPPISRRTVLRGLGVAISLPWLESMGPLTAWAETSSPVHACPEPHGLPVRAQRHQHGRLDARRPKARSSTCPPTLQPLASVKDRLLVLTGLTADKARPHGDGGGDHARALGAFLTGAQPRKTDGTDIRAGMSVDQVAAGRIGDQTWLPSLEIGCEAGSMAGNCDSGYSCVYSSTMSWRSATQPLPKEVNPKAVFERLFSTAPRRRPGRTRRPPQERAGLHPRGFQRPRRPPGRQRPPQTGRVLLLDPRHRTADCQVGRVSVLAGAPAIRRRPAFRRSTKSTCA